MRARLSRHHVLPTSRVIRSLGQTARGALAVTILTGCAVGQPSGFTARSNATCADASARIAKLSPGQ